MGSVTERITVLLVAAVLVLAAGCGRGVNFSQDPDFAAYFRQHPPATSPADPADQALLLSPALVTSVFARSQHEWPDIDVKS